MIEKLNSIDADLLLFFNHLNNPVLDFLMYWFSYKIAWIPFYAILAWIVYRRFPQRFISILIFTAITIALSDQLSSIIKNHVMRLRPCHDPVIGSQVHLVYGYCGGQYGFVSSHATNSFALATFLILLFRNSYPKLKWVLITWAIITSYSRIYLGAHYPGDVIGGIILGTTLGFALEKSYRYYELNFANSRNNIITKN